MNYLYFDIECCDGNHICSFGYVVVNDEFTVLEKDDILINPEKRFQLGRANFDPAISLAYSKNAFRRSPNFRAKYGEIKQLLTRPNQIILGHAVASDLNFLDIACTRYGKKRVDIDAYDTQKIYADNFASGKCCSLDTILKDLGIDMGQLVEHKSCDDAELTMLAVKQMCARQNVSVAELLHNNAECIVSYSVLEENKKRSRIRKSIKLFNKKYDGAIGADKIYFSAALGLDDVDCRIRLIERIYRNGYAVTTNIADCIYVVCENGIIDDKERNALAESDKKEPQFISVDRLHTVLPQK